MGPPFQSRCRIGLQCHLCGSAHGDPRGDLKERGLLDETLVVWAGEFGRTPLGENRVGRAGGRGAIIILMHRSSSWPGVAFREVMCTEKPMTLVGPVKDAVHINDLQATLLHLFGLDHQRLTYRHHGAAAIDFRDTRATIRSLLA